MMKENQGLGMVIMNILSAQELSKTYGEKILLHQVSFGIDSADRIGLIGVNGTGKSTLLKMIAGMEWPDSGKITLGGRVTVHYLPQEPVFDEEQTVLDGVFQGDSPVMRVLREYEQTLNRLGQNPIDEALQRQLLRLQSQLEEMKAWQLPHEAKIILTKLGITDYSALIGTLSGGQKKRIALARALIQPADLLILDEPTNHIDNESVLWLETYLQKRQGALFMVTHDRYFLDRVVNRIFELDHGQLYSYPGNYSRFVETKLQREESQRASEEKRQNFLRNELEWIKRGPRARGTKQKARTERYYEMLDHSPETELGLLDISTASSRLGKRVIELQEVRKSFGREVVIRDFTYLVLRRDRVGIVGPNGAGKSTLLKVMAGDLLPDEGTVQIGQTVKIGWFRQEHAGMDEQQRVIDFIRDVAEYVDTAAGERITAAQMLERFLFPGSLQWTPIAKLSGGEKRRLVLLRTLMSAPNVLLLDEPTNDLDIQTLSVLESYLDDFPGAVVVVSHDRYFLDRVTDKTFAFEGNGHIVPYTGTYSEYLAWREKGALSESRVMSSQAGPTLTVHSDEPSSLGRPARRSLPKFTFKEQKEYETIEDRVAETEDSLAKINAEMAKASGEYGRLQELYTQQQELEAKLNHLLERWTYLSELAEEIERTRRS